MIMNLLWSVRRKWDEVTLHFVNNFILHKSVRWYRLPDQDYKPYRYPAPGSEPIWHKENKIDYKTAFRDSHHSIRHDSRKPKIHTQFFITDPITETEQQKRLRFNVGEGEEGAKHYQQLTNESLAVRVHQDDFGIGELVLGLGDRGVMEQYVRQTFQKTKKQNELEAYSDNLDDEYTPNFWFFRQYDYAADDPVFRQVKLELEYYQQNNADLRKEWGSFKMFKGDPNFWMILDNSFSSENIKQVQATVRDTVSVLDKNVLDKEHLKTKTHREDVIPLPIKNNYVD